MKIIKNGDVRILSIEQHSQSYPNILRIYTIHHSNIGVCGEFSGKQKIQIKLYDKLKSSKNPTILSTGDDWSAFDQDDAIEILINEGYFRTTIVYFNKKYLKCIYNI